MGEPASVEPKSLPSAHPWRRFMGIIYEGVILFGVLWLANYLFSSLTTFTGEPGNLRTISQLFLALVLAAYFGFQWAGGRRTLPMKTMELQLVDAADQPLTVGRAVTRYFAALAMLVGALGLTQLWPIAFLLVVLPASWTLLDPQRRALYDIVAGTRLIKSEIK